MLRSPINPKHFICRQGIGGPMSQLATSAALGTSQWMIWGQGRCPDPSPGPFLLHHDVSLSHWELIFQLSHSWMWFVQSQSKWHSGDKWHPPLPREQTPLLCSYQEFFQTMLSRSFPSSTTLHSGELFLLLRNFHTLATRQFHHWNWLCDFGQIT